MPYNKRVPVNITLSKKLVKNIKEYKKLHPEFNLSRYIEAHLLGRPVNNVYFLDHMYDDAFDWLNLTSLPVSSRSFESDV